MNNPFLFIYQNQNNMKQLATFLIAALLVTTSTAYSQIITSDAIVTVMKVKPLTDVSNEQLEAFYLEEFFPAFYKEFSVPMCLLKKIQGNRMEEHVVLKVFESLKRRNQLYPKPGVITDEAREGNKNMSETWKEVYEIASKVSSTGYYVLPVVGKSIDIKAGNIVVIRELEHALEEGMTNEELEQFYQEAYGSAFLKNNPGSQFCVFKGEREERAGKYTELIIINSMEEFEKWNAEDGIKAKQSLKNMGEIQERMERMYTSSDYNVYIVL
jgi:hypothetical protein